jgi:hypothetical protein
MIQALESVFEGKSALNKLYLRNQLLTLKCGSKEHFLKLESLINKLQNISGQEWMKVTKYVIYY